VVSVRSHYSY